MPLTSSADATLLPLFLRYTQMTLMQPTAQPQVVKVITSMGGKGDVAQPLLGLPNKGDV